MGAKQAQPKADHVENTAEHIQKIVDTAATLRFLVSGARNLAVAAIHNAVELKEECAEDNAEVISVDQTNKGGKRKQERPRAPRRRSNVKAKQKAADKPGKRSI